MLNTPVQSELVLLVDDDNLVRSMAAESLRHAGFSVMEADSGKQALALFASHIFHLVLLDVILPDINGYELCETMRQKPRGQWIPILMMTGLNDRDSIEKAYSYGATDFIIKPLNWYLFTQRVRYLLRTSYLYEALLKGRQRLADAHRLARIGSWEWRVADRSFSYSDELRALFKTSLKLDGTDTFRMFLNVVRESDRKTVLEAYRSLLQTGQPYQIEYGIRQNNGEIREMFEQAVAIYDALGVLQRVEGITQDITDRKNAEVNMRIAATAFESGEAMVITDVNAKILRVNRAFTRDTGYTADEVIGRNPNILRSTRHDADFFEAMWTCIAHTGSWQGEIWDKRKDGSEYQKWLAISSVKDLAGHVTHYIGVQYDITARKQAEARIHSLAFYDQLTGLPNRILLQDRIKQAGASSERSGSYCGLLLIDLDNFKILNDTLGHAMGDQLLKQVSELLSSCVREEDTVARLGGDEFVVMLANLDQTEQEAATRAESIANEILATLDRVYELGVVTFHVTASMGVCLFKGRANDADELLKQADLAMYRSKDSGRNSICFFDQNMEYAVAKRAALENILRESINAQHFAVVYQAQVTDDLVFGAEALIRWNHPMGVTISPGEFIPLAEETGLIIPLGNWMLETVCAQLAQWSTCPHMRHLAVAVNVSARQFLHTDFVQRIADIITATGADPSKLKLELTESILAANLDEIISKMTALKAIGLSFSLDDFGTGYSSLSYLKKLPIDQLKIDRSFVCDMLSDENSASIVKTIITLARGLSLDVIAEGVEQPEQCHFLIREGCHAFQGFYFAKPLPQGEFEQFVGVSRADFRQLESGAT